MDTVGTRWALEDEASLRERLLALRWTRTALAAVTLLGALATAADRAPILLGAGFLYALAFALDLLAELRVASGTRPTERVLMAAVLLEGAALVIAVYAAGGSDSPVRYALVVHAATTALLVSGEIAVRSAVWVSLLLLVSNEMQELGLVAAVDATDGNRLTTGTELAGLLIALWLTTLLTARATAINERVLQRERLGQHVHASFGEAAALARTPGDTARVLAEHVLRTGPIEQVVVLDVRDDPVVLAHHGRESVGEEPPTVEPDSLLEEALEQRTPVRVRAPYRPGDAGLAAFLHDPDNIAAVPMVAGDGVIAVLLVVHGESAGNGLQASAIDSYRRLASHAALALAHAWAEETLEEQARTDRLTGVANRYTFDEQFDQELARARRERSQLSLVMCDIDHFKRVNDLHGHQVGDRVLADVAATLEAERRPYDVVARYGGEEFVIILSQTDFDEAMRVAERLRREVEEAGVALGLTASFGVATAADGLASRSELISTADAALYAAKERGRNRVEGARTRAYDPSGAEPA